MLLHIHSHKTLFTTQLRNIKHTHKLLSSRLKLKLEKKTKRAERKSRNGTIVFDKYAIWRKEEIDAHCAQNLSTFVNISKNPISFCDIIKTRSVIAEKKISKFFLNK